MPRNDFRIVVDKTMSHVLASLELWSYSISAEYSRGKSIPRSLPGKFFFATRSASTICPCSVTKSTAAPPVCSQTRTFAWLRTVEPVAKSEGRAAFTTLSDEPVDLEWSQEAANLQRYMTDDGCFPSPTATATVTETQVPSALQPT